MRTDEADILSEKEVADRLTTKWAGRKIYYLDNTDSTNTAAKQYAEQGAPHGTTVIADMQTKGRGRRGREWQSPSGRAVYMTIMLRPDFSPNKAPMLTLVMALSVTQAIYDIIGLRAGIKWPNDIVLNAKKVCGILTEMSTESDCVKHVVIGVGINANNDSTEEFSEEIRQKATSLKIESGIHVIRAELIERVLYYFEKNYDTFVRSLDLSGIMDEYSERLINRGAKVRVLEPQGEYSGVARGINASGELLVEKENGEIVQVYAGEVSVRGIYGYV